LTPGFKFNDWEMRGVPLRAEIGPKDVEKGTVALVRRDIDDRKQAKSFAPQAGIAQTVPALLGEIQASLLGQAIAFRDAHLHVVDTYDDFKAVIEAGDWALAYYDGSAAVENQIKADTGGATSRCFPLDQEPGEGACIVTGKKVAERAWF